MGVVLIMGELKFSADDLVNVAADDIRSVMDMARALRDYCEWLNGELMVAIGLGASARAVISVELLRSIVEDLETGDNSLHGAVVGLLGIVERAGE